MTLGKMIRTIREEAGFTQAEMAAALSISDGYMSQLESGKRTAELRFKDDVYWRLSKIASRGVQKICWDLYVTLVGLDADWRDPMIYETLGQHFYQRIKQEQGGVGQCSESRRKTRRRRAGKIRRASNY